MSKSKTIAEQIDLLQSENENLKELNKLFEKAIKLNCQFFLRQPF